ncbi:hypothetical protein C8R47DRAFT_1227202 [Mycena vitilis]|nr:hypothetical protein C8R47DRAFT_1227202 [Mycena vitilis]
MARISVLFLACVVAAVSAVPIGVPGAAKGLQVALPKRGGFLSGQAEPLPESLEDRRTHVKRGGFLSGQAEPLPESLEARKIVVSEAA